MALTTQISEHLSGVLSGGNWTSSNLKEQLADLTWQQATEKVFGLNSIAALTFHIDYFVNVAIQVLKGELLNAHDKFSFDLPLIRSQSEWDAFRNQCFANTETLASLVAKMPEHLLWLHFSEQKYGNYYRNIHGIIEHTHYHLGQIVLIKKILQQSPKKNL